MGSPFVVNPTVNPIGQGISQAGGFLANALLQKKMLELQQALKRQDIQDARQRQLAGYQAGFAAGGQQPLSPTGPEGPTSVLGAQIGGELTPTDAVDTGEVESPLGSVMQPVEGGQQPPVEANFDNVSSMAYNIPVDADIGTYFQGLKFAQEQKQAERELEQKASSDAAKLDEEKQKRIGEQAFKLATPTIERGRDLAANAATERNLLEITAEAINEGDLSFGSQDYWAQLLDIPALATARGAQFKSAVKEQFVKSLGGVSAKGLNQFLEKQLNQALPQIGQSRKANLAMVEIQRSILRQKAAESKTIQDLYESQIEEFGGVQPNFNRLVREATEKSGKDELRLVKSRLTQIEEGNYNPLDETLDEVKSEGLIGVSPDGRRFNLTEDQVDEFIRLGGTVEGR